MVWGGTGLQGGGAGKSHCSKVEEQGKVCRKSPGVEVRHSGVQSEIQAHLVQAFLWSIFPQYLDDLVELYLGLRELDDGLLHGGHLGPSLAGGASHPRLRSRI